MGIHEKHRSWPGGPFLRTERAGCWAATATTQPSAAGRARASGLHSSTVRRLHLSTHAYMLSICALYLWAMARLRSFDVGPVESRESSQAVEVGKKLHAHLGRPADSRGLDQGTTLLFLQPVRGASTKTVHTDCPHSLSTHTVHIHCPHTLSTQTGSGEESGCDKKLFFFQDSFHF